MTEQETGRRERQTGDGGAPARAQTETIGVVILIGVTVIASVALVAAGASVIDSTQRSAEDTYVERSLVQFDARADEVSLGESTMARSDFGDTKGFRVDVQENAGRMTIVHHDANGDDDEVIYDETLGAVRLQRGETTLAYQGGGVWRSDGAGTVMVSKPAMNYRDQTLTFPVVRVQGSDSAMGAVRAVVRDGDYRTVPVFPNETATYASGVPYQNTLRYGHVTVTVGGEYYDGWARYWREHTTGRVSVDHANRTADLDLYAYGTLGSFQMPDEGEAIEVRGYAGAETLGNFSVDLAPDDTDAAQFDNLQWSMYAEEGDQQFEVHLRQGKRAHGEGACKTQTVDATVYYSETGGDTYEGWHADDAFTSECTDRDGDGVADETRLVANLTGETRLEQTELSSSHLTHFSPSGGTEISGDPGTFAATCDDPDCDESAPVGDLTGYYLAQLGMDFDIVVDDKSSDTVNENASSGYIEYPGEGRITYLHVTENTIDVELE
ncbi:putative pilin/flagellin [Halanaeroarchaeum sp. HSR-CO]|uniref:DUF7289 family protein n=1 Tax=Halanaeroarchaeum sp. HSR-CO TaxID=2866382 RepID=UPI00217D8079|nr:archaellin/type IV pilin N-terminal domain-containing protein [Halanaeroarchaeum sp. HSR-CO]UWG46973.1 putative pilin/flagellin [Halanaeroarchaeum sp. HSR-CO]